MTLILIGLSVLIGGGIASLALSYVGRAANIVGALAAIVGALFGLVPAVHALTSGTTEMFLRPWNIPYGSFYLELDSLSAVFLLPVFGVSALAALYGSQYLPVLRQDRTLGIPWALFNMLIAAMAVVVLARNAVLFLIAWEVMSWAAFFLATLENEDPRVRQAGRTYLIATHLGTAFLLAFFVLLGQHSGSRGELNFTAAGAGMPAATSSLLFVLALIGFGTKAGLMPFHVWLPEIYPVAPHHVTAVMSGAMSKVGLYGLVRALLVLGMPAAWWSWVLIALGASGAIVGILLANAQADLKRLLAYSSIENMSIIALGLGTGMLGVSAQSAPLATLGFAGALLHALNHSVFKSLLFLGAGSVQHATGTRDIEELGGLLKRLPWTGAAFLVGAIAICGLPPLNGFVSEYLIYRGAFHEEMRLGPQLARPPLAVPALAVVAGLALAGGLAAACFIKAFAITFLGEPRSELARNLRPTHVLMRIPVLLLAGLCFVAAAFSPAIISALEPSIARLAQVSQQAEVRIVLDSVLPPLVLMLSVCAGLVSLAVILAIARKLLLARREVTETGTWDCGYAKPTSRMQYTGSSFAQPITSVFAMFVGARVELDPPSGLFPAGASIETRTADICHQNIYRPTFRATEAALSKLRWLQHGRIHLYVLYIAATILALLVWYLGLS